MSSGSERQSSASRTPVAVSHIEYSTMLWIQSMEPHVAQQLLTLSEDLKKHCEGNPQHVDNPQLDTVYGNKFSEDNSWYRCIVKNNLANNRVRVHYIDYGNWETVLSTKLVELPEALASVPKLASKLWLHNMKVVESRRQEAISKLRELTEEKVLMLTRFHELVDGLGHYGFLHTEDTDTSIVDTMVDLGLLTVRENKKYNSGQAENFKASCENYKRKIDSIKMLGSKQTNKPVSPTKDVRHNAPTVSDKSYPSNQYIRLGQQPNINEVSMPHDSPREKTHTSPAQHEFMIRPHIVYPQAPLTNDANNRDSRFESVLAENQSLHHKLKSMQDEFNKLSLRTSSIPSFNEQIQQIGSLTDKLRKCRRQFSMHRTEDVIEASFKLLNDQSAVTSMAVIPGLTEMRIKEQEYNQAQANILQMNSQSNLEDIIDNRNSKRIEFCDSIQEFIRENSTTILENRQNVVNRVQQDIEQQYKDFLGCTVQKHLSLVELSRQYTDWKEKCLVNFTNLQVETTRTETAVCHAFRVTQEHFSLSTVQVTASVLDFNVDHLLRNYANSLENELKAIELYKQSDSSFLATVVHNMMLACKIERENIGNVLQLIVTYSAKLANLSKWLHDTPNVDELTVSHKSILGLRSKLRHKLADLQDIEENEDRFEDEEQVRTAVYEIRKLLHAALLEQENLVREMAQLAKEHFPELNHRCKNLKLHQIVKYGAVLKDTRQLDYYSLTPVPKKHGVYLSVFNDESVFIKEYNVMDHCTFLDRALAYQSIECPALTPLHAVFFSKNSAQCYTQTPVIGRSLIDAMKLKPILPQDRLKILQSFVKTLEVVHKAGFCYGSINPSMLRWTGTDLYLDEFDLCGSITTIKDSFMINNLRFQEPKTRQSQALSHQSDFYCLGLITLWLNFPDINFSVKSDGSPSLNGFNMPGPLKTLLDVLIDGSRTISQSMALDAYYQYLTNIQEFADNSAPSQLPVTAHRESNLSEDVHEFDRLSNRSSPRTGIKPSNEANYRLSWQDKVCDMSGTMQRHSYSNSPHSHSVRATPELDFYNCGIDIQSSPVSNQLPPPHVFYEIP